MLSKDILPENASVVLKAAVDELKTALVLGQAEEARSAGSDLRMLIGNMREEYGE